jgi:CheY-like chemotaxis protein
MISEINKISPFTRTLRLLFVEDEKVAREQVAELLEYFFYDVTTASNGKEGFEKYQNEKFDLIITDIKMPIMDGIEMVKRIRHTDKKTPVIFLSQHNEPQILLECINLYIDGYVLKPII